MKCHRGMRCLFFLKSSQFQRVLNLCKTCFYLSLMVCVARTRNKSCGKVGRGEDGGPRPAHTPTTASARERTAEAGEQKLSHQSLFPFFGFTVDGYSCRLYLSLQMLHTGRFKQLQTVSSERGNLGRSPCRICTRGPVNALSEPLLLAVWSILHQAIKIN